MYGQYRQGANIMSIVGRLSTLWIVHYGRCHTKYVAVLCPEWKKWWLKHPNLEIVPPIRAKIVGEKHKLVFLVVVICYLVVVNWL